MTITMQTLEALEARLAPAPLPKITANAARHQILGAMKLIARMADMPMQEEVYPTELFVRRVDQLEAEIDALRREIEEHRRALMAISAALEAHTDPFGLKPASKWTKTELAAALLAAGETITWATQRADNLLDPDHAQPIAKDPDTA